VESSTKDCTENNIFPHIRRLTRQTISVTKTKMMRRNTRQRGGASAVPEVKNPTNKKSSSITTTTNSNSNNNNNRNKKRKGAPATPLVVDPPAKLISGDSVQQQQVVEQVDDDDNDVCVICEDVGTLLICDGCEKSYHPDCLDPPLEMKKLPDGNWFCFQCNNEKKPAAAVVVQTATNLSKRARRYTATITATVAPKDNISWMDSYQKLMEYKNKHNGCTDVPHDYNEDAQLGRWVAYQRGEKKKLLTSNPQKFEMLNLIGFQWKISPLEGSEIRGIRTSWMDMYIRLIDYKKQHNDTNVLRSYYKDPKLGRWVSDQRIEYRNNNLPEDKQSMLDKIGFEWSWTKTTTTNERSKSKKRPPPPQPEVVLAALTEQTAEVLTAVQAAIQVDQQPAQMVRAPPSTIIIDEPNEYDILFGRGGRVNLHVGNTWYRNVVKCSRNQYLNSPKHSKKAISEAIVEATQRNVVMGRFLKQHKNSNNRECWIEVPFRQAVNKTSQALRERYMLDGKKAKNKNNKNTTDANKNENGGLPLQEPITSLQQQQHQQPVILLLPQACISLPMQVPIQADHHQPQLQPPLHPPPPPPQQQQLIQEGWYLQELLEESGCNVEMV
jgi:hypothetical protein